MSDQRARARLRTPPSFVPFSLTGGATTLHGRFEQQAARRPDAPAVVLAGGDVSYAALNRDADRAAAVLDERATSSGPVALLLPQGYASIVWTLAVLKTARAYAPLDQRLPVSALRDQVDDLAPSAIVAAAEFMKLARSLGGTAPVIDAETRALPTDARAKGSPDDAAYVFYTSGSTGTPKGVHDSHRNVLHNVLRYTNTLMLAPDDRLSLVQNPSFSGTVSSLFGALLNGAAVVPLPLDGDGLAQLSSGVLRHGVTVFHAVPSIFRALADPDTRFPHVRVVRLEGDRAMARDVAHFKAHFRPGAVLVNGLGATECGLVRQCFVDHDTELDAAAVPLGHAVPDVDVSIVDEAGRELPAGDVGEIVVRSEFLATGYWNRPDLTARRFEIDDRGRRRYRTGDLGRLRSDGCLEHLGRVDHRVRIAGTFVDTDAIERTLQATPGVAAAVVHDYTDRGSERRLCAYVVRDANAAVSADTVRERCAPLGAHATPSAVVFLDALPLTKDRKVDRGRLPAPGHERPDLSHDRVAPATPVEERIAQVWRDVLELSDVGVTDRFLDVGGDSLRAARIAARLERLLGTRISVISLFEHPTIRELARAIGADAAANLGATSRPHDADDHRVAIVGMAARFAGAESVDDYWRQLREGREGLVEAGGAIADVDRFDAARFGLTPHQARCLDPQQRVWLECAYRALEDAGIPVGTVETRAAGLDIGVFVGGRESTYLWHLIGGDRAAVDALLTGATDEARDLFWGNDRDALATRTSYLLGLTGPSLNVQTACSTSLVAVAEACQSLVDGRCDAAIAGGVAVTFPQARVPRHETGGMHSRDGHCRPFDAEASGTVFSDGVGAVILKRFADAERDGDRIEAVIRGWAVTNDGSAKASFTAPGVEGQARAIARAHAHAGVAPADIGYVEAHGSATPVGDPIEVAALTRAFRASTDARAFCGLGSVKSNIGHADTAAGIAGLIKTVLALRHRELPPTLHFRAANPGLDLESSPFFVVDRLQAWPAAARRIAGVSSLGVGGTNCHVIVEEAPAVARDALPRAPSVLVPLSAPTASSLAALEARVREFVVGDASVDLHALAVTAQRRRAHHPHRAAIRCATLQQLAAGLTGGAAPSADDVHASGGVLRRWEGRAVPDVDEDAAPQRDDRAWDAWLETLALRYVRGASVDWNAVSPGRATPVRLPSAPFERTRHWYDGPLAARNGSPSLERGHPLLGRRLRLPGSPEVRFETRFSQAAPHFLGDHRLFGVSLPPAASYLSMLAEAGRRLSLPRFDALYVLRPLLLPDGQARLVQLILKPSASGYDVELTSAADDPMRHDAEAWTTHLVARASAQAPAAVRWDLAAMRDASTSVVDGADFYERIWANQGGTGSSFRWIDAIWQGEREALCRAVAPPGVTDAAAYALHPGLLEAACQVLHCCGEIETATTVERGVTLVPFSVDSFAMSGALPSHAQAWCHARLRERTRDQVVGDLTILGASGEVVATLTGFCLRPITRDAVMAAASDTGRVPSPFVGRDPAVVAPAFHAGALDPAHVVAFLRQRCAELSGYPETAFSDDGSLIERGIDSLAAMRLANDLGRTYGRSVSARDLLASDSLQALATALCRPEK
jgi:amino acid adenylation domain-containing protein